MALSNPPRPASKPANGNPVKGAVFDKVYFPGGCVPAGGVV